MMYCKWYWFGFSSCVLLLCPMIKIKYDIDKAEQAGVKVHPQMDMWEMGYVLRKAVPDPATNSWLFEVEEVIEPLPEYMKEI